MPLFSRINPGFTQNIYGETLSDDLINLTKNYKNKKENNTLLQL